jgi:hypothetical protein
MPSKEPHLKTSTPVITIAALLFTSIAHAAGAAWTDEQAATAKWMIAQADAWSNQACGGKWVLSDLLADDFQGTSPKGTRYVKPSGAPSDDANTKWSTDCRLDEADVHFLGSDIAVVYGAESKTVALPDGRSERRCLVWTDTWVRRAGRWQIVAAQDTRVDCPAGASAAR